MILRMPRYPITRLSMTGGRFTDFNLDEFIQVDIYDYDVDHVPDDRCQYDENHRPCVIERHGKHRYDKHQRMVKHIKVRVKDGRVRSISYPTEIMVEIDVASI